MPKVPKNVYRRGDRYYFRAKIKGREVRKSLGANLQEARRLTLLMKQDLQTTDLKPSVLTAADFSKRWRQEYVAQERNEKGQLMADQRLKDFILPHIGQYRLDAVRVEHMRRLRASIEQPRPKRKRLSPQTVKHVLSDVRCLFRYAVEVGEISESPFRASIMPKIKELAPQRLTDEQVKQVLDAAGPRHETVIKLLLYTAIRWGELHRLQWRHVKNLPEPHLVIEHTKSDRVRRVPLNDAAQEAIRLERERTTSVFVSPLRAKQPRATADYINRRVGFHFKIHSLRHTYASRWIERGLSVSILRNVLGHSTVKMTERYGDASDPSVFAEAKRLGSFSEQEGGTQGGTPSEDSKQAMR